MSRISRRTVLKGGMALAFGFAQEDPASARPKEGDLLVRAGDPSRTPLTSQDVTVGVAPVAAWSMDPATGTVRSGSRLNQILLVRLDGTRFSEETKPRAVDGVVAYSAICTHDGCEVDDWLPSEQLLHCGCHFSKFDPKDGAKVVDGPAPRGLPALPLKVVEGKLVVAGPFTGRVG